MEEGGFLPRCCSGDGCTRFTYAESIKDAIDRPMEKKTLNRFQNLAVLYHGSCIPLLLCKRDICCMMKGMLPINYKKDQSMVGTMKSSIKSCGFSDSFDLERKRVHPPAFHPMVYFVFVLVFMV